MIINKPAFEGVSIFVIIINSGFLAIEDPTTQNTSTWEDIVEWIFLALYTMEMVLKILGMGFLFCRDAYLRDSWNILDFIIVVTAYIPVFFQGGGVNLTALRSLRVLRPLRAISSIKNLKNLIQTIFIAVPFLMEI